LAALKLRLICLLSAFIQPSFEWLDLVSRLRDAVLAMALASLHHGPPNVCDEARAAALAARRCRSRG
jgi:hypothetical protein